MLPFFYSISTFSRAELSRISAFIEMILVSRVLILLKINTLSPSLCILITLSLSLSIHTHPTSHQFLQLFCSVHQKIRKERKRNLSLKLDTWSEAETGSVTNHTPHPPFLNFLSCRIKSPFPMFVCISMSLTGHHRSTAMRLLRLRVKQSLWWLLLHSNQPLKLVGKCFPNDLPSTMSSFVKFQHEAHLWIGRESSIILINRTPDCQIIELHVFFNTYSSLMQGNKRVKNGGFIIRYCLHVIPSANETMSPLHSFFQTPLPKTSMATFIYN